MDFVFLSGIAVKPEKECRFRCPDRFEIFSARLCVLWCCGAMLLDDSGY